MSFPIQPLPEGALGQGLALVLAVVALVLIFAGRKVIKVVAFLLVGLVGALVGSAIGGLVLGAIGVVVGALLGFIIGGLAGVALLALGIGLIIGYAGYALALDLSGSSLLALVLGFVLFIIGLALHNKVMSVVTAVAGGILLYDVLRSLGIATLESTIIAALLAIVGIYVQTSTNRKMAKPAAPPSTAPPTQPR